MEFNVSKIFFLNMFRYCLSESDNEPYCLIYRKFFKSGSGYKFWLDFSYLTRTKLVILNFKDIFPT